MPESREPQPHEVAVELLTLYLGTDGPFQALQHWEQVKHDWGGQGDKAAVTGLLDMNQRLLYTLAQRQGVANENAFALEYLRALALGSGNDSDS